MDHTDNNPNAPMAISVPSLNPTLLYDRSLPQVTTALTAFRCTVMVTMLVCSVCQRFVAGNQPNICESEEAHDYVIPGKSTFTEKEMYY